jgi:SAM-dependent methyltransferase
VDLREASSTDQRRHPWEVARSEFFSGVLRDAAVLATAHRVLDVGSGDAWFARRLLQKLPHGGRIDCVDSGYSDEHTHAAQPAGLHLHASQPEGTWDVALLLDVLEHVEDDRDLLALVAGTAVAPGGWVLISVPAWQGLFTSHDTFLKHHRRYSPVQGRALIAAAGLKIVRSGGLFHGLLAPRALSRLREAALGPRPLHADPAIAWRHGAGVTAAVQAVLAADNLASRWLARAGLDVPGLSWWALCRK